LEYRVDEKGKLFTNRITKDRVRVVASTGATLVSGVFHVSPEHRIKDELNQAEAFIAITDAEVQDERTGRVLYSGDLVLLNKQRLVWIMPEATQHDSSPTDSLP
jgi:hypothetical protein